MIENKNKNNRKEEGKYTTRSQEPMKKFRESKVKIYIKDDIKESIIKENEKNHLKKKIITIAIVSFIGLALIISTVLLVGHLCFSWFKNKEPLIIDKIREEKLVSRYSELKKSINYYNYEGVDEDQQIQSHLLNTDFIVGLNKKERLDKIYDFNNIDYLYEAYILILNITHSNETDSIYLGGFNIYDEEKSLEDLIEINNEFLKKYLGESNNEQIHIPFAKFYFYENGTIDKIYFPKGINDYYKTLIIDLIEKTTPKLSKSLYKDESNKRRLENGNEGTYLNYEEIKRNGQLDKTIIYEDKIEKNLDKEKDEFAFKNKQLNSKTVRTFNSTGDMTILDMEGEVRFISSRVEPRQDINNEKIRENEEIESGENNSTANESFHNLGFNEFKLNAKSNMLLIKNGLEPKTLTNLKQLSELLKMELYQKKKPSIYSEDNNEPEERGINEGAQENKPTEALQNNENNPKRNLVVKTTNFRSSYNFTYDIISLDFLGLRIEINQKLHINKKTGLRQNNLTLYYGKEVIDLGSASLYQYYNSSTKNIYNNSLEKVLNLNSPFDAFGFIISVDFPVKVKAKNGIYINITNGEMYVKGYETVYLGVSAKIGVNLFIVSFGVKIKGHIADGDQYILANTQNGKTGVEIYRKFNRSSVDLELYFSVWILFWKKTFSVTFNLQKGYSSYNNYYQIL